MVFPCWTVLAFPNHHTVGIWEAELFSLMSTGIKLGYWAIMADHIDVTVKPVLNGHSKEDERKDFQYW